jgi:hypothetical protein
MTRWSFPVQSTRLDDHLAFVRQEVQSICGGRLGDDGVFVAAQQIGYILQLHRWTQARYAHFRLSDAELRAIDRFVRGWRSSGPATTRDVTEHARALADVGLTRP